MGVRFLALSWSLGTMRDQLRAAHLGVEGEKVKVSEVCR